MTADYDTAVWRHNAYGTTGNRRRTCYVKKTCEHILRIRSAQCPYKGTRLARRGACAQSHVVVRVVIPIPHVDESIALYRTYATYLVIVADVAWRGDGGGHVVGGVE